MIYEIRVYEATEDCADAMRQRFLTEVVPRMPRHGIELIGVFITPDDGQRLTNMSRFPDETARTAAWASFVADPEWKAIKAATETNGPLVEKQTVSVLSRRARVFC